MAAEREFVTRDLSLAAYLAEHGLVLRRARRNPKSRDFEFVLEDPDGRAEDLAVEWSGSCCRQFEARVKSIKALMWSVRNSRGS